MAPDVHIIYSPQRKTIGLTVERDNRVVVRAPEGTPLERIERAVASRRLWLFEKQRTGRKYPAEPERKEFVTGEALLYLGRHYRLDVSDEPIPGVQFQGTFVIARHNQAAARDLFRCWYTARARERLIDRARHFAAALGVKYGRLLVSDLKFRWGSCTPRGNLNFNWRIIKAPSFVLDYLVVHELAHLLEPNHTPRFWTIVAVQVPRWEQAKTWLKDHGHLLEVDF